MPIRRSLLLAAALAVGLSACAPNTPQPAGTPTTPPTGQGTGGGPAVGLVPTAADASVDCDALAQRISSDLTAVIDADYSVTFDSEACTDPGGWLGSDAGGLFGVDMEPSVTITPGDLDTLLTTLHSAWQDPEVLAVAPNVPRLEVLAGQLTLTIWDGFVPLDPQVSETLVEMASQDEYRYAYFSVAPGITHSGVPIGTQEHASYVRLSHAITPGDAGAQAALEDGWVPMAEISAITAIPGQIHVDAGTGSSIGLSLQPGADLPADLAEVAMALEAVAAAEPAAGTMTLSGSLTDLQLRVVTIGEATEIDPATEAALEPIIDAAEAWGGGSVSVVVAPPIE